MRWYMRKGKTDKLLSMSAMMRCADLGYSDLHEQVYCGWLEHEGMLVLVLLLVLVLPSCTQLRLILDGGWYRALLGCMSLA